MISNTKCLWTFLLTTLISILTEQICQCGPVFDGKPSDNINDTPLHDSLAKTEDLKRDWSKFTTWGKRGFENNFSVWGKRNWENFHSWGKRGDRDLDNTFAQINPHKREWSKFAVWGKRNDAIDSDKREWSSFQSWGKRDPESIQDAGQEHLFNTDSLDAKSMDDKRAKWGQMAVWGKRDSTGDDIEAEKRRWAKLSVWGKRGVDMSDMDMDKRKWSQLATWGKRDTGDIDGVDADKRAWVKIGSLDKRRLLHSLSPPLGAWGKRRWTGLNAWGKRSVDTEKTWNQEVAQRLLNLFDFNGDGALDVTELSVYIETLMSLPSIPEMVGDKTTDDIATNM